MARFGQQTRLVAKKGRADALVAKFLEAAEMQHGAAPLRRSQRRRLRYRLSLRVLASFLVQGREQQTRDVHGCSSL
jgi:hypothetical protein